MKNTVTAREAAQILGVSAATLYSYVSRGLLASLAEQGVRSKRYDHGEVLRLAARRKDGKQAGHAVEQSIDWGKPILESRITLIRDGVIRYRGHDALKLARSATLEQAAAILWNQPAAIFDPEPAAAPAAQPSAPPAASTATAAAWPASLAGALIGANEWRALRQLHRDSPPLQRAAALMAASAGHVGQPASAHLPPAADPRPALMRMMAAALLDRDPDTLPLHQQCRRAWRLRPQHDALVRAALIVCADHELNVSTFTVRCVASSGAELPMALAAGLAALSGRHHGGESLRALALIRAVEGAAYIHDALRPCLREGGDTGYSTRLPGFGHPLYPQGDPRAALLLELLAEAAPDSSARLAGIAAAGARLAGQAPNIDFSLAAIEHSLGLPHGASQVLFALGRSAGWLAHACEQIEEGRLIRPRARYVGSFDWKT